MKVAAIFLILSVSTLAFAMPVGRMPHTAYRFPSGPPGVTDYPWTMFHHDALRSGATPASAPSAPNLMWTFSTGAAVYPSPIVADGIVFIPSYDGNLYALDEFSGAQKWVFYTSAPIYATPAVSNGIVYLASKDTALYAIDEKTGIMLWKRINISPITSSPVAADGKLFYGTWFHSSASALMALYANNGTVAWQYLEANDTIKSSPAVSNGRVFFGQNSGIVVALNESNGQALWGRSIGSVASISTSPALGSGKVFVGADSGTFAAFDQITGSISWTYNIGSYNSTSSAVNNGIVYFGTARGVLYARNALTGNQVWNFTNGGALGSVTSSPAVSLGSKSVLFGSADSNLYAINMTTGVLLWKYSAGGPISSSPAIADGRVFFGSWDDKVYALGVKASTLSVSVIATPTSLKTGQISSLTITVTNGTTPVAGASFSQISTAGGSFTSPIMTVPGTYESNFTTPIVSTVTITYVQVVATKSGFLDGSAQTTITVSPLPTLTVIARPKSVTLSSGGSITVQIQVMNGSLPISGAQIALNSSAGGGFSTLKDAGNGNYSAVFNAPTQSLSDVLTIKASKAGFATGQNTITITVQGPFDLTGATVAGFPLLLLIAAVAIAIVGSAVFLMFRGKREPAREPPPVPTYMMRRGFREALTRSFRIGHFTGLAAIAGS